ncbi:MAG TPA: metal-sensitive transcriptional regulator [bacterium]|nr:metal-sensitive transcriptional regulator [bacterium]
MATGFFSGARTPEQRINIIIGQLNALKKAIAGGKADCSSVITQIKATKSGLDAVMEKVLEEQLDRCLKTVKSKPEVKKILNYALRK